MRLLKLTFYSMFFLAISSCTVRYITPPAVPVTAKDAGDLRIMGVYGSTWGGYISFAPTDNFAISGSYNYANWPDINYISQEIEGGMGFYKSENDKSSFFGGGFGYGNNYGRSDSTGYSRSYEGEFYRPYFQFNVGKSNGEVLGGLATATSHFVLKTSYFMYRGRHLYGENTTINSSYLMLEPGFFYGVGGKNFEFNFNVSFPFRPALEALSDRNDARVNFVSFGVGLSLLLGD